MRIVFEKGDRGLICRSPEDGGAWVVPAHRERHAVPPTHGHIVAVEIVGTNANGRLRFARITEDISVMQATALEGIKAAAKRVVYFDDLRNKKWGAISIANHINPWSSDVETCLDEEGRPAVEAVRVRGFLKSEWGRVEQCSYDAPKIRLERPLPLGPAGEEAPLVLAYHVVAMTTGYDGKDREKFVTQVNELSRAVQLLEERTGKEWHPRPKPQGWGPERPVLYWLRDEAVRTGATTLRDLIARVELPLEAVKAELTALTADQPTHIRFTDGYERTIKWSGRYGRVEVERESFSTLTLDLADERTAAIRAAGHTLWLKASWEWQSCSDRHNDLDSHYASDRRQII